VAVSKNGKLIASGSSDNTIILYDAATYKTKAILEGHKSYVMSIAFSPDGILTILRIFRNSSCFRII
jgi:WD40 repeat protein